MRAAAITITRIMIMRSRPESDVLTMFPPPRELIEIYEHKRSANNMDIRFPQACRNKVALFKRLLVYESLRALLYHLVEVPRHPEEIFKILWSVALDFSFL